MSVETSTRRRAGKLATFAVAAAALCAVAVPPAQAASEPYLGWDFGNGLGVPPSAYDSCPTYGWSYYPYRCAPWPY
jgi:hypothetical protein